MDTVNLLLDLADTALELWQDSRRERHRIALVELKKRYMREYNKEQMDFNILDQLEQSIKLQIKYLCVEARKPKAKDMQG